MKVVIVGYGTQGKKRFQVAKKNVVAIVDPNIKNTKYKKLSEIDPKIYDCVLLCVPDNQKIKLIDYCIKHKKHILVEKPIICSNNKIKQIQNESSKNKIVVYTAYNHRFEPNLISVKKILNNRRIGKIYYARIFYGNGTAKLVRNSPWRDKGNGVIGDLGSHLLDLYLFLFNDKNIKFSKIISSRYENKSFDHSIIVGKKRKFNINLEMSMCSWRNEFFLDIYGSLGSVHVKSLCKWGPSNLIFRKRKLPSGKPYETKTTIKMKDPTWIKEYNYFTKIIKTSQISSLENDIWINNTLEKVVK